MSDDLDPDQPNSSTQVARPDSASHWYLLDDKGKVIPFHEVPYAGKRGLNGEMRSATLRDARQVGAAPSVTNVLSILHKEFLTAYKVNQAILSCATLPHIKGESVDDFARRAYEDSKEHAASAARFGSACHEIAAEVLKCPTKGAGLTIQVGLPLMSQNPTSFIDLPLSLKPRIGERCEGRCLIEASAPMIRLIQDITPEQVDFATLPDFSEFQVFHKEVGYAGTCDGLLFLDTDKIEVRNKLTKAGYEHLLIRSADPARVYEPVLAMGDLKTRGGSSKSVPIYETDILQLAAYLHAIPHTPSLGFDASAEILPCCNLMLNTHADASSDPDRWEADIVIHDKVEIEAAWKAFTDLFAVWCWLKSYNPAPKNA